MSRTRRAQSEEAVPKNSGLSYVSLTVMVVLVRGLWTRKGPKETPLRSCSRSLTKWVASSPHSYRNMVPIVQKRKPHSYESGQLWQTDKSFYSVVYSSTAERQI